MPLYEYQCPKCGRFELIQKFAEPPLKACPTCGAEVQKLPSAPAIQFKGTGWYITDYARKSEGKGKSESGKGESGKGESGKGEGAKSDGSKDSGAASGDKAASSSSGDAKPASESSKSTKDTSDTKS